jgi:hypothetical protein
VAALARRKKESGLTPAELTHLERMRAKINRPAQAAAAGKTFRSFWARMSPEERSAELKRRSAKAWATRRANTQPTSS